VYQTEFAGTAQHTLIGWTVSDIDAAVRELAGKGVSFERYDKPDFKTDEAGMADMGGERAAWFKDPEGNLLRLWQLSH
jgi:predicted enzyme related to lactoylglutathione lyase